MVGLEFMLQHFNFIWSIRWWATRSGGGLKDLLNLRLLHRVSLNDLAKWNGCITESVGIDSTRLACMQLCHVALDAAVDRIAHSLMGQVVIAGGYVLSRSQPSYDKYKHLISYLTLGPACAEYARCIYSDIDLFMCVPPEAEAGEWEVNLRAISKIVTEIDLIMTSVTTCKPTDSERTSSTDTDSHLTLGDMSLSRYTRVSWPQTLQSSSSQPYDGLEYDASLGSTKSLINFECRMLGGQEKTSATLIGSQVLFQLIYKRQDEQPTEDAITGAFDLTCCGVRLQPRDFSIYEHSSTTAISWWKRSWHSAAMQGRMAVTPPDESYSIASIPFRQMMTGQLLFIHIVPRLGPRVLKYMCRGYQLFPVVLSRCPDVEEYIIYVKTDGD